MGIESSKCYWMEADPSKQMSSQAFPGDCFRSLLFLAFINDLPEAVRDSDPRLFADDCLLYKLIKCDADAESVQQDLQALEEWERKWQMKFNPEKCQVIRIITNKRHERHTEYRLQGQTLEVVDSGKYLGVTISDDLSWHKYVDAVAAKESRTLGFLQRNLGECTMEVKSKAYTSLVRPLLEYASPAWDPTSSEESRSSREYRGRQLALSMAITLRGILDA